MEEHVSKMGEIDIPTTLDIAYKAVGLIYLGCNTIKCIREIKEKKT